MKVLLIALFSISAIAQANVGGQVSVTELANEPINQTAGVNDTSIEGLSAKTLTKILSSKEVVKVLTGRSIESLVVEPLSAMESTGYIINLEVSEPGIDFATNGPSSHACFIQITAIRSKSSPTEKLQISTEEICADNLIPIEAN